MNTNSNEADVIALTIVVVFATIVFLWRRYALRRVISYFKGVDTMDRKITKAELKEAARPLVEYLNSHGHPHMRVIVDVNSVELTEGLVSLSYGCECKECEDTLHASDCAVHDAPALPPGPCNCGTAH